MMARLHMFFAGINFTLALSAYMIGRHFGLQLYAFILFNVLGMMLNVGLSAIANGPEEDE